jgi:signal transduction histidine kinase
MVFINWRIVKMKELFRGQLDYVFFFYGLSFFLMAVICFSLGRDKLRRFPWVFLGSFGLVHAISEWTDMLMVIYGNVRVLREINLIALLSSYLLLFEFVRVGFFRLTGRKVSGLAYLPLIVLFYLVSKLPSGDWVVIVRYLFGFPAAYLAARIIYEFAKQERESRYSLTTLAIMIGVYAVFSGLVVPKAGFFPARFINFDSFFDAFGVPVQLMRGICAMFAALAIWFYSSVPSETVYQPKLRPLHFMPTKWIIAMTMMVFIGGGWVFTNYLDYYGGIQVLKKSEPEKDSAFNIATREVADLKRAVTAISGQPALKAAVSSAASPDDIDQAKHALERYKNSLGALSCILIDAQGSKILSAGGENDALVMSRFSVSAPYFKAALAGKSGYYFRPGQAYNDRVYYVGYPLKDNAGKISGVVVIVKNIHAESLFQYRLFSIVITFLLCIIAIIFFIVLRRREVSIRFIERVYAQLEEIDSMKTDFISTASHELRTPLTSIRNAADILIRGGPAKRPVDDSERELLKIIVNNVDRQSRIISDLLDVSKIESGIMPVSLMSMDITVLVEDALIALRQMADDKKISMSSACDTHKKMAYADPDLVRRMLNNLIVNAIKFTAPGGKVTVSAQDMDAEMRVAVSDSGIGISDADKEKIFVKFCRLDKKGEGCGLGLAITKGLVEAQNGKVWVKSQPGKGSTFYFTLPIFREDNGKK